MVDQGALLDNSLGELGGVSGVIFCNATRFPLTPVRATPELCITAVQTGELEL